MADIKGDLSGIGKPGSDKPKIRESIERLGLADFAFQGCPVVFWDVFGEQGHNVRATISEMGPLLLARLLNLNETQSGVLSLVFKIADDQGLLLLDLKDLRAMLEHVGNNAREFMTSYGTISAASIGAIQRGLLTLEEQGGGTFFGEPALNLEDLMQTDPRLVFFFDEAHLLFNDAPKILLDRIEQVIRLIRSKGVGVYFVTQNPIDIPDLVLGQLGNRFQHALRAFTPRDQKAVKAAAETFRANPKLEVEKVISELGVGEALVSPLDEEGRPGVVERARICPPHSQIGPLSPEERRRIIQASAVYGFYEKMVDRESAYEILKKRTEQALAQAELERMQRAEAGRPKPEPYDYGLSPEQASYPRYKPQTRSYAGRGRQPRSGDVLNSLARSAVRVAGSELGRQIVRGVLGGILGAHRY